MKYALILILTMSLFSQKYARQHDKYCDYCDDDFDHITFKGLDIDDGTLTIRKYGDDVLVIEEDGTLFVDEKEVETTREQRQMLKAYVRHFEYIIEESVEIGLQGAEIGLEAAGSAIAAVFSFDLDEMEEKLEKMEKEIEEKTEDIEERAEELEFHAEEFAAVRCILKRQIEELDDLREF